MVPKRSRITAALKTAAIINLTGEAFVSFGRHAYLATGNQLMNLLKIPSQTHLDVCLGNGAMNF